MSNTNNGSTVNLVVATQGENPSFLKEEIQLKKLAKELSKATSQAIEILLKCLESNDERVRFQAATKLLEFQINVAKEISHDQIQRLIAEIKLNRQSNTKMLEAEDERKNRPIVDFSTIRQID